MQLLYFQIYAGMGGYPPLNLRTFRRSDDAGFISFPFNLFPALLHNGRSSTLLQSICYARFSSRRRGTPPGFQKEQKMALEVTRVESIDLLRLARRPSRAMLARLRMRQLTLPCFPLMASGPTRAKIPSFRPECRERRGRICPSQESAGRRERCFFRDAEGLH